MERVDVLEDVGVLVGEQNHIKVFQWLINIPHRLVFNGSIVAIQFGNQTGKVTKKSCDTVLRYVTKQTRKKRFSASGADRSRQHYHCELRIEEIRVHCGSCAANEDDREEMRALSVNAKIAIECNCN